MAGLNIDEVADFAQNSLADASAATWPQATVEEWVSMAIRDYETHFHRLLSTTVNCDANVRTYNMDRMVLQILNVQYPYDSSTPYATPTYLTRKDRRDPDFWDRAGSYDYRLPRDSLDTEIGKLYISEAPAATEKILYVYHARFFDEAYEGALADEKVTVPDEHVHILIQYVMFLAAQERLNAELADPDRTLSLLQDLTTAAKTAKKTYDDLIAQAAAGRSETLITPPWRMDTFDKIY